jgi:hypothetical protein
MTKLSHGAARRATFSAHGRRKSVASFCRETRKPLLRNDLTIFLSDWAADSALQRALQTELTFAGGLRSSRLRLACEWVDLCPRAEDSNTGWMRYRRVSMKERLGGASAPHLVQKQI